MSIRYSLTRTTTDLTLVAQVPALKTQARIPSDVVDEDDLLYSYVVTAQEAIERELGIALVTQTWVLRLDRFPAWEIRLPRPPLQSVTTIKYIDGNGDLQTLSDSLYTVDIYGGTGRVMPVYGQSWPVTQDVPAAVTITYVAGWADADSVPRPIYMAILREAGLLYEHREEVVLGTIRTPLGMEDRLVANYRCTWEPEYN